MRLTIDSREPLADVLRALGGMFGVTLSVGPADNSAGTPPRRGRQSLRTGAAAPDPKVVRAWAVENGYPVSSRGSLSAEVRNAYAASLT